MIFHLSAGGYPCTWTICAVYKDSLGVAIAAADCWYDRTFEAAAGSGKEHDAPQAVIEMIEKDGAPEVGRTHLRMGTHHLRSQMHDQRGHLIQMGSAPFAVSDETAVALTQALGGMLVAFGFMIPKDEWERRYPSKVMISARFAEFQEAHDARGADLAYEPKWSMFMPTPAGTVFPHELEETEDGTWWVTRHGERAADLHRFAGTEDDAAAAMRMLNSGWSVEEVVIHMTPEPVG